MQLEFRLRPRFHVSLLAALLLCHLPLRGQVGLGLEPMRVDVPIAPGSTYSDSLQLTSQVDILTHVRGEVLDFYIDEDENPQFGTYPAVKNSCRDFLRVTPRDSDIAARENRIVRYTFKVPDNIKNGTYHCAIGFTTQPVPSGQAAGLAINVQVVTAFYINVGKPVYSSEVKELSVQKDPADPNKPLRAFCLLRNSGEYVWRPIGELDVVTPDGQIRDHVPVRPLPVFPDQNQRFLFPLKTPVQGGDILRLRIDVGNGEIEEANATISEKMLAQQ
jgi:hypothetical protein